MRRVLFSGLVLLATVFLQVTVVNSLSLPGGTAPDLVLVVVAALAVTGGPLEGALAGFCGGLALDVAPPAVHLVGQYALVFCLVGYAVGRLAAMLDGTAWLRLGAVAASALLGEALLAGTGIMFSEPDITWTAVRQVLPVAVIYECMLSPFVLAAVAALRERTGALAAGGSVLGGELAALTSAAAAPLAALAGTTEVVRNTGTRRSFRLRGGQAGSALAIPASRSLPARPVNLRLGSRRRGDRIPGAAMAVGALGDARTFLGGARPRAGSFRGGPTAARPSGQGLLSGARPRAGSFRGGPSAARRPAAALFRGAHPRKGSFSGGPTAARPGGAGLLRGTRPRKGSFGGGPSAARPAGLGLLPAARPRKGTFSGGPSAARRGAPRLAGRQARLRIGSRRPRDGVVGGSITSMLGRRAGRGLGSGRVASPRFRSGGALSGRSGRRGGFGGGGMTGLLPGTRLPSRRLRLGSSRRRSRFWRFGSKRLGRKQRGGL